jgi:hypothetical protein
MLRPIALLTKENVMSLSKTLIAGAFTLCSVTLATAGYAQESVVCLDGSIENGDCIVVLPEQAQAPTAGENRADDD